MHGEHLLQLKLKKPLKFCCQDQNWNLGTFRYLVIQIIFENPTTLTQNDCHNLNVIELPKQI